MFFLGSAYPLGKFGLNASIIFSSIFKKIYNINPKKIEPQAISQTSMARLKFLDDNEMLKLKKYKFLDTVLAARRKKLGKIDDYLGASIVLCILGSQSMTQIPLTFLYLHPYMLHPQPLRHIFLFFLTLLVLLVSLLRVFEP